VARNLAHGPFDQYHLRGWLSLHRGADCIAYNIDGPPHRIGIKVRIARSRGGLAIATKHLPKLAEALVQACAEAETRGLVAHNGVR
jgi:hypothetical protein